MQNIFFIPSSLIKNQNFVVAGLVVFSKQNLTDCASSVYVGFILACMCAYIHLIFLNFQFQE